jgi:alpha-L-fucosidase 2
VLNFSWNNGQLQQVQVMSKSGGICKLQYHDKVITLNTQKGMSYRFDGALKQI